MKYSEVRRAIKKFAVMHLELRSKLNTLEKKLKKVEAKLAKRKP